MPNWLWTGRKVSYTSNESEKKEKFFRLFAILAIFSAVSGPAHLFHEKGRKKTFWGRTFFSFFRRSCMLGSACQKK